jgi:hypothetical protein
MEVKSNFFRYISTLGKFLDDPYNHPQPSICHKTMAVKWHSEPSRWHAPPHRQFTFSPPPTALHIRDSLARRMCPTFSGGPLPPLLTR